MLESLPAILLLVVLLVVFGTLGYGAWSAAPWVPLGQREVERMLDVAELRPGELFYDLGCGDGRLLTAAARRGATAVGFEIALLPYTLAQVRRLLSPQRKLISVRYHSFWTEPFSSAQVISCFLTPYAMRRLEPKLAKELRPGSRFVTYAFKLPTRLPSVTNKPFPTATTIYRYDGH